MLTSNPVARPSIALPKSHINTSSYMASPLAYQSILRRSETPKSVRRAESHSFDEEVARYIQPNIIPSTSILLPPSTPPPTPFVFRLKSAQRMKSPQPYIFLTSVAAQKQSRCFTCEDPQVSRGVKKSLCKTRSCRLIKRARQRQADDPKIRSRDDSSNLSVCLGFCWGND